MSYDARDYYCENTGTCNFPDCFCVDVMESTNTDPSNDPVTPCTRNETPTNRFGCSYVDCGCTSPCYEKVTNPLNITVYGGVTFNGDVNIIGGA